MTDHGNMFGAIEFDECVPTQGVKPIIGCEVYVAPAERLRQGAGRQGDDYEAAGNYHLVLLATNQDGL